MLKEGVSNMSNCLSLQKEILFVLPIRAFPEDRTGTEPAGEIRGNVHEQLSHTKVGPTRIAFKKLVTAARLA